MDRHQLPISRIIQLYVCLHMCSYHVYDVSGPRMDSGAWYGADGHAADERDGWLQGRSSTGSGALLLTS